VIVAGRLNIDIVSSLDAVPTPGMEVGGGQFAYVPGGKGGNQAVAAARAGADVALVAWLGMDPFGDTVASFLRTEGVSLDYVSRLSDRHTSAAFVMVGPDGGNTIVYDEMEARAGELPVITSVAAGDVLVCQYGLPQGVAEGIFTAGHSHGGLNVFNAAPAAKLLPETYAGLIDVLVMNEVELAALSGRPSAPSSARLVREALRDLTRLASHFLVVTLGDDGALLWTNGAFAHFPAEPVDVLDTTGAGDAFTGALATALSEGKHISDAVEFANAAAALAVTQRFAGPSMPSRGAIVRLLAQRSQA